nr:uroporphyrinogen decarboxylase [Beutenbergia cavernae]
MNHHTAASPSPDNSPLLAAYHGRPVGPAVWFMRQAGRSLPEYRAARAGTEMLEACLTPELAAEITLQPVRRHGVDAAIFFSDIVVPLALAGVDVHIEPGLGPVIAEPVRDATAARALAARAPGDAARITEAVRLTVAELGATPLIGFAGAPFTLAAYLVEGRPSRDHLAARTMMHADPEAWDALLGWVAEISGAFLRAQVMAGASAVQLFDSWAGSLGRADYAAHVQRYSARTLDAVADLGVPMVHFGTGTSDLLDLLRDAIPAGSPGTGPAVVGVDHRIGLDEANARLGGATPLQGNIDPAFLAAPWPVLEAHVRDVVARGTAAPGHVVNLGHGVPPDTDPGVLTRVVELVHGG